jgi:hypothetical protein
MREGSGQVISNTVESVTKSEGGEGRRKVMTVYRVVVPMAESKMCDSEGEETGGEVGDRVTSFVIQFGWGVYLALLGCSSPRKGEAIRHINTSQLNLKERYLRRIRMGLQVGELLHSREPNHMQCGLITRKRKIAHERKILFRINLTYT